MRIRSVVIIGSVAAVAIAGFYALQYLLYLAAAPP
jgi:hypothetical protein